MIDMLPLLDWTSFVYFALPTVVLLAASATLAIMSKRYWAIAVGVAAVLVLAVFIGGMWHSLERPPMRTMGETRLWYSLFVIIAGLIVFIRWRYGWILSFSGVLSTVFMAINVFKPEIHNKTMMPALESPFFVPHVISYIFAYSLLAAAVPRIYRSCISYDRVAARCRMGKTGVGHILGLGPQRDVGSDNVTQLSALHTPPSVCST